MSSGFNRLPARSDFFVARPGKFAEGGEEQGRVALAYETLHQRRDVGGSVVYIGQKHNRSRRILLPYPLGNVGGGNVGGEAVIEENGVYGFIWWKFESAHRHENGQAPEAGSFHDHSIDLQMRRVVVDEQDGSLSVHCTSD